MESSEPCPVVYTTIRFMKPCGALSFIVKSICCFYGVRVVLRKELTKISFVDFFLLFIRLYGSLRVACGWILWNIRFVDDGAFRRRVCEALFYCYVIQTLAVLRAQLTDSSRSNINWIAILVLGGLAGCYGSFRYRKGGNLIKVYELPTSGNVV